MNIISRLVIVVFAWMVFAQAAAQSALFDTGQHTPVEPTTAPRNLVGMTLWFVPNPSYRGERLGFIKSSDPFDKLSYNRLFPKTTVKVKVLGFTNADDNCLGCYAIKFSDGTVAYVESDLAEEDLSKYTISGLRGQDVEDARREVYGLGDVQLADERFYRDDPVQLKIEISKLVEEGKLREKHAAEVARKKTAQTRVAKRKAAERMAARGGVTAGMTREEVLSSNWGRPSKINKTATSYSVHEQWVYDNGNYLYFEDGVLTTIQTSR